MWTIKFSQKAEKSLKDYDKAIQKQILAGIKKVGRNPLPHPNGYGKPAWSQRW